MKQVIAEAGEVKLVDVPAPKCKDDEVLVKNQFSVISTGTESWTLKATRPISSGALLSDSTMLRKAISLITDVWRKEGFEGVLDYVKSVRAPVVPLGYSCAGIVTEVGRNVADFVVGDRAACAGEAYACHAEYVAVPRNLVAKVPQDVNLKDAAFATLGAIAIHGFRQSSASLGEKIAIIGTGLVGSLVVQACKAAGCRVVALDSSRERADIAGKLGADLALTTDDNHLEERVKSFSNGRGVDAVIICASTSSSSPVNLASRIARDKARITIVGRVGMDFERKDYYQKELETMMSRSLGPGRYDASYESRGVDYPIGYIRWTLNRNMEAFLDLVQQKRIKLDPLVAGEFLIEDAKSAYAALGNGPGVASVLKYSGVPSPARTIVSSAGEKLAGSGDIRVALVGPGNFAKETLIPLFRTMGGFTLRWVVSSDPLHARQVAQRYRIARYGTDILSVLEDSETDLVVISTPNNLHFPMVLQAIRAGKPTFVEKPLCIKPEELDKLEKASLEFGTPIFVGFNRRYAPLAVRLKKEMSLLDGPFLISYRINADFIPAGRWAQDPSVSGGRVIHEACHFFDFANFLLDSSRPKIVATSVGVSGSTTINRDNFVVNLQYPEGSVVSILYSALGNRKVTRERIEVFAQGTVMSLEDFRVLTVTGKNDMTLKSPSDKGYMGELQMLRNELRGRSSQLATFQEVVDTMRTTFDVDATLRGVQSGIVHQV